MRSRRGGDRLALALFAGCAVIAAAMGGLAISSSARHAARAVGEDGNMATAPKGTILVILDKTDPFTEREQAAITDRLRSLAQRELRQGERLSIWAVGDHAEGTLTKQFCRCSPGFSAAGITDNARMIHALFDSTFARPMDRVLADVTRRETAPWSPIMESLREVGELKEFTDVAGPRRVLLVSDMLQNSKLWSQYTSPAAFPDFSRRSAWRELRANLDGSAVEIVYLHRTRDASHQGAAHREFWREYFRACGATSVTYSRI